MWQHKVILLMMLVCAFSAFGAQRVVVVEEFTGTW
jgi:hypothetical protein